MSEQYVYDIGFGTYDESSYWQYSRVGPNLSEAALREIVRQCILDAWNDDRRILDVQTSFQDLMGMDAFHESLEKCGFQQVVFAARFSVFGWAGATVPGDWGSDCGDGTLEIQTWLREATKEEEV